MSSVFGGPTVSNVKPPAPVFPGMTQAYNAELTQSGIGPAAFGTLASAATTGLPTDVGPAFEALKASMKDSVDTGATNLREQFGASGLSTGSDLQKAGAKYESTAETEINQILAQYQLQASEAAANRQVAAAGAGAGFLSEPSLALAPTQVVSQSPGALSSITSAGSSAAQMALLLSLI